MRRLAKWQEKHGEGDDFTGRRAFGEHPERWQDRFEGMRQNMWARNNGQDAPRDSMASASPMVGNGNGHVAGQGYPAGQMISTGQPGVTQQGYEPPAYPAPTARV